MCFVRYSILYVFCFSFDCFVLVLFFFNVRFRFFGTVPKDGLGRMSLK